MLSLLLLLQAPASSINTAVLSCGVVLMVLGFVNVSCDLAHKTTRLPLGTIIRLMYIVPVVIFFCVACRMCCIEAAAF